MWLVDALVVVANRHHMTWTLTVDNIVLLRRGTPEGRVYVVRILTDPPTQLWTAVIATPQPGDTVTGNTGRSLVMAGGAGQTRRPSKRSLADNSPRGGIASHRCSGIAEHA